LFLSNDSQREQQVKEELIDLLKQGVDLEEAQQIIERRAKEFEDDKNNAGLEKIEEKKVVTTNDNEEDEEEEGEGDDEEGENEDEEEDTEENHFLACMKIKIDSFLNIYRNNSNFLVKF